jgi:hypothetical protein
MFLLKDIWQFRFLHFFYLASVDDDDDWLLDAHQVPEPEFMDVTLRNEQ